jgi:hypothetical protein
MNPSQRLSQAAADFVADLIRTTDPTPLQKFRNRKVNKLLRGNAGLMGSLETVLGQIL